MAIRVLSVTVLIAALAGCSESSDEREPDIGSGPRVEDPGPVHVHGLGVNPRDRALFIATHTGLFRAARNDRKAKRVAGRYQDTMGFTVVGPDRFLGSGHPDGSENLPPFLGLIESRDAGRSWEPISLLGKRDFHVLEATGGRVYGFGSDFETREASLLVSDDGGRRWEERTPPEALVSLAIDPEDTDRVVVSGEQRLYESPNGGRGWRPLDGEPSHLAWPAPGRLFAVNVDGVVSVSSDGGGSWQEVGDLGGGPAAFESGSAEELYAALHDGTVKRSTDGGVSWSVRSTP
jgi:photosystem II stability/assembly factor-like uncharacterized protein